MQKLNRFELIPENIQISLQSSLQVAANEYYTQSMQNFYEIPDQQAYK